MLESIQKVITNGIEQIKKVANKKTESTKSTGFSSASKQKDAAPKVAANTDILDQIETLPELNTPKTQKLNTNNNGIKYNEKTGEYSVQVERWTGKGKVNGRKENSSLNGIIDNAYPNLNSADRKLVLKYIQEMNKQIKDVNVIHTGDTIKLPVLEFDSKGRVTGYKKAEKSEGTQQSAAKKEIKAVTKAESKIAPKTAIKVVPKTETKVKAKTEEKEVKASAKPQENNKVVKTDTSPITIKEPINGRKYTDYDWASYGYNSKVGNKIAQNSITKGGSLGTYGNCLGGVKRSLYAAIGEYPFGAPEQGTTCAYLCADILAKNKNFREIKGLKKSDLTYLPPGAVVVWDNNIGKGKPAGKNVSEAGKKYGHISIAIGDGRESSDHISKQITERDATFRVFIPV